nr:dual specificity protein kinase lkh1 [Quercus suber]
MSTPQTLHQAAPPHLDHRQRYLPSPQDRYLPPPRPSSNLSNSHYQSIPARPSSNLSSHQLPPPRLPSDLSYAAPPLQARSEHDGYINGYPAQPQQQQLPNPQSIPDPSRASSRASQSQRPLPLPPSSSASRAPHSISTHMPAAYQSGTVSTEANCNKKEKPVDWVAYFGGKPPTEIITIHDDDSPAPPSEVARPPPSTTTNGTSVSHHIDKRRRVNGAGTEVPTYSATNTPYSYTNGTSTESLHTTTAATSLASQASSAGKLDNTQTGQKRKRTTRTSEQERKKLESEQSGHRGYLAEYGDYVPPPKQHKKQRDVAVPAIPDRHKTTEKVDDGDGHYIVHENSRLGERYTLVSLLGQGTFGKVVRALDYRDASRIELRVLHTLRAADEHNRNRCIQLRDCFDWRGHICIVTPLLGLSVFDFLKQGGFVPFPGSHIQAFARQLLGSIAFLHDLNLVHTDLKPENILLLNHTYQTFTYNRNIPSSSTLTARSAKFRRVLLSPQINLIDFGSATFDDEYHSSVVSTRHYRAPEIILGVGTLVRIWWRFLQVTNAWRQAGHTRLIFGRWGAVTGKAIDKSIIREVNRTAKRGDRNSAARFFKNGQLAYPQSDTSRQSKKFVRAMRRLEETIPPMNDFNRLFLDLLRKIFVYDPKKRITAREALKHPWFDELVEDDGTEAGRIRVERERQAREREQDKEVRRR